MQQGNNDSDSQRAVESVKPAETPRSEKSDSASPRESEPPGPPHELPGTSQPSSPARDFLNLIRGFCMGAADTVPGVSGGTVALILGHYERLVAAISHIDGSLLKLAAKRRWGEAAAHTDLRFLIALGLGIGGGVVTLAGTMHWLLEHRMPETLAVFFGLVLASAWIVGQHIDRWTGSRAAVLVAGAAAAAALNWLPPVEGQLSPLRLFVSASVAICAMILPGISGAFVLLLLGVYHPVTGLVKHAVQGDFSLETGWQLGAFAAGCATGLLAFSRLLRWLLEHRRGSTMAALLGLMVGSVGQLWPLQRATTETAGLEMQRRQWVYVAPSDWPGSIVTLIGLAVTAAVAVWVIERIARRAESNPERDL